jgi:HlyD family secretion protein
VAVEEEPNALRAPLGALFRQGDGWATYKVVDGSAVLTPVETGIPDENFRVVKSGLEAGDIVILFPGPEIADGTHVAARNAK